MTGWPVVRVGDISEQVRGVTYPKTEASSSPSAGRIALLRAGNITGHGLSFNDLLYVPESRANQKQRLRRGDVVIAASSGSLDVVGKAAQVEDDSVATFGAFCKVLRPSPQIDPRYFMHYFRTDSYRRHISRLAAGININNLRNQDLDDLDIPLPPPSEQRRIAAILDHADALRAKRRETIACLNELIHSIFVDMSGQLSQEPLGPKLDFVTSGGRGWARYYADKGVPFIRSLDVQQGYVSLTDLALVAPPDNAEASRTRTQPGDVLLTITGSRIGRAATMPTCLAGSHISQHVAILRPRKDAVVPEYLSAFLTSSEFGQRQIAQAQYGQTKPGLNFNQIRKFSIPAAPLALQYEFVNRATSASETRDRAEEALAKLDSLFTSLQYRAFRGEL